jgi:hypothetical protein
MATKKSTGTKKGPQKPAPKPPPRPAPPERKTNGGGGIGRGGW